MVLPAFACLLYAMNNNFAQIAVFSVSCFFTSKTLIFNRLILKKNTKQLHKLQNTLKNHEELVRNNKVMIRDDVSFSISLFQIFLFLFPSPSLSLSFCLSISLSLSLPLTLSLSLSLSLSSSLFLSISLDTSLYP